MTPSFVKEVKTNTMFIGGIAPGITDATLRSLLNVSSNLEEVLADI